MRRLPHHHSRLRRQDLLPRDVAGAIAETKGCRIRKTGEKHKAPGRDAATPRCVEQSALKLLT
jgi:hypothetical protein